MNLDQAVIACGGLLMSLTVGVVGFVITRAVRQVDAKVDTLISKDTLQDILIGANQSRVDAQIEILNSRIVAAQNSALSEISAIKEEIKWLTEVTRPIWAKAESK